MLFDDFERTFDEPMTELEPSFIYLNRSARPAFAKVRKELERWFANYPESAKRQLKLRLREEFESAFYELFLHELLVRMGAKVEIEPNLGTRGKRPDFAAKLGGAQFVLEAKVFFDESTAAQKESKRNAKLYDAINEIEAPFFLAVERVICHSCMHASTRGVKAFLIRELEKIDPDFLCEHCQNHELPLLEFKDDNITMKFRVLPKSREGRARKSRLIGMTSNARWSTSETGIRDALKEKGNRYGEIGHPFVIGVNTIGELPMDNRQFHEVLFGTVQEYVPGDSNQCSIRLLDNGFWGTALNPKYTRVSGVVLGMILPWNAPRTNLVLYRNPWAAHPLYEIDWPIPVVEMLDGEKTTTRPKQSLGCLFELDCDWPGEFFSDNRNE